MQEGVGNTDTGKTRDHNEDSYFVDDALGLYAVCDGMGGHAAGEVASAMCIQHVVEKARAAAAQVAAADSPAEAATQVLVDAALTANAAILAAAKDKPELRGMGCTLTVAWIHEDQAAIAHVGDSRAYRVTRAKALEQLTDDHSLAAEMARAGAMKPEEAKHHAFAHVLTRAMGTKPELEVDGLVVALAEGDRILLCSDGLSDTVDDPKFLVDHVAGVPLEQVPDDLIAHANQAGGPDNVTVVVVRVNPERHKPRRRGRIGRIRKWLDKLRDG